MNTFFIKRNTYLKDEKDVYIITFMYNNIVTNSLVDKKTFDWFSSFDIGDEIPNDYVRLNLYQTKDGIKATIKIVVD